MILDNPFRQLGLTATASTREVRRSLEDAKVDLDIDPDEDALIELSRLRQQLEDPLQRVRHEVFWIHGNAVDVDVTDASAVAAMLPEASDEPPSREQAIALHDVAVLSYARYLEDGRGEDPSAILALWAAVAGSGEFWRHLEERALDARDARITPELIEEIRAELSDAILAPLSAKAGARLDAGDIGGAAEIVRAMRTAELSPAAVDAAANRAVSSLRASVDDGLAAVQRALDELVFDDGRHWALRNQLTAAEDTLVTRVLAPLARLHAVDPWFADPALGDRAANVMRSLAIDVCKSLQLWEWGYVLMRQALTEARSPALVAQLAVEQAEVAMSYHRATATEAAKDGYAVETAAHNELALTYARDEDERTTWRNLAAGARSQQQITAEQLAGRKRAITARLDRHCERLRERAEIAAGLAPTAPERPDSVGPVPAPRRTGGAGLIVVALLVLLALLALAAVAFGAPAGTAAAGIAGVAIHPSPRTGADVI